MKVNWGELRVKKSYQVLNKTDIAVVVIDGTCGVSEEDLKITERIQKKEHTLYNSTE